MNKYESLKSEIINIFAQKTKLGERFTDSSSLTQSINNPEFGKFKNFFWIRTILAANHADLNDNEFFGILDELVNEGLLNKNNFDLLFKDQDAHDQYRKKCFYIVNYKIFE
ncbi:MAG: hypothetical protein K4H23_04645 [Mollicutes bacterium PWAP]|nr:hypothetical protein [Mollicutes bacterium PWAP]